MEKRALGRTGERLSVIGFGGIVVRGTTPAEATGYVERAVGRGVNYFDVGPSYGDAEERLGPALAPFRDGVFLAGKTLKRSAKGADEELRQSLERLRTDRLDLYQFHGVRSMAEAEEILAPGGALEAFVAAKERGLIRHIGFSAHSEEAALRLLEAFPFDSVLFPVNIFSWRDGNFGPRLCQKAQEKGAGVLALKALAKRRLREGERKVWPKCWYCPIDTPAEAKAALAFTLSRPVAAAVSPSHAELLWLACDAADALGSGPYEVPDDARSEGAPVFPAPEA